MVADVSLPYVRCLYPGANRAVDVRNKVTTTNSWESNMMGRWTRAARTSDNEDTSALIYQRHDGAAKGKAR